MVQIVENYFMYCYASWIPTLSYIWSTKTISISILCSYWWSIKMLG